MRLWPAFLALAACGDETVTAYSTESVFALVSVNGAPFQTSASIDIGVAGEITGSAPCNSYRAKQTAPYPWFEIGPIAATKRACPDLEAEAIYFETLGRMTIVEVSGSTLILTNDANEEMLFQAP